MSPAESSCLAALDLLYLSEQEFEQWRGHSCADPMRVEEIAAMILARPGSRIRSGVDLADLLNFSDYSALLQLVTESLAEPMAA